MRDFSVSKFCVYSGPNYYLGCRAVVFNLYVDPDGPGVDFYEPEVLKHFPQLGEDLPSRVSSLFVDVLIQVLKMDLDLYLSRYAVSRDGDELVVAVEYLDDKIAEEAIYLVSDWFKAMNASDSSFDFAGQYARLQADFDKTMFGGPTLYSLIEGGLKRGIPVNYLYEENQFQWGYGCRQVRGRSTTFHVDSIKDTEFTMYKDIVKDFLLMCGFPTPVGKNCYSEDDVVAEAEKLGFPVVCKPLAGHKGQGVTTGIESVEELKRAFHNILKGHEESGTPFEGAIVEQQIYGTDHRLLAVGGKFVAALERVPAYVDGDGVSTIAELIARDNEREVRADTPRSPLCKIKIDDNMIDFLRLQNLTIDSVPAVGQRVELRRVANISAGGVSINVTDRIHPLNVKLVEDIAKYFKVTCLGIDVLAKDISQPWTAGNFGIIEINAGPGVFMHLAPAIGQPIDVPGRIMAHHFPSPHLSRIPIIAGNCLSDQFCGKLYELVAGLDDKMEFAALTDSGLYFNNQFFCKNKAHDQNVKIALRNPELKFAAFNHDKDSIFDYGIYHEGADIVILDHPHYAEEIMARQVLPGGYVVEINDNEIILYRDDEELKVVAYDLPGEKVDLVLSVIGPLLPEIYARYR
ncbi:MAG: cyanophycin synthetase [Negativicutes bacterium]|nr:cyanophycin synthetase [Negativicutes bacterium]